MAAAVAVCPALDCSAFAQTFAQNAFARITWNISTPGARPNGMGRAFTAVADDATAPVANPAGLTMLLRPQVYVEFKNGTARFERFVERDSLITHAPTFIDATKRSLSFMSLSAPVGSRMALGFSRHEFLTHDEEFSFDIREIPGTSVGNTVAILVPSRGSASIRGLTYAGSFAFSVSSNLRVGAAVSANELTGTLQEERGFFPELGFTPGRTDSRAETDLDDWALGLVVGAIWERAESFTVGFAYAMAPRFDTTRQETNLLGSTPFSSEREIPIAVPDRVALGVAFRPTARLLLSLDVVRVGYSRLEDTATALAQSNSSVTTIEEGDLAIDTAIELHLGAEVGFAAGGDRRVFLRGGMFTDPAHGVRYVGNDSRMQLINGVSLPVNQLSKVAQFNLFTAKDRIFGTVGGGATFGSRLDVSMAYVHQGNELVISTAVRF